jgi:23S rRNA (pseudouridine1915-N3)-methyltransferase
MKVHILSISDTDKHFSSAIAEYEKRLWKEVKIHNIKPVKYWSRDQIIEQETQKILKILEKKQYEQATRILLYKGGKMIDSLSFAKQCKPGSSTVYIIWWPYGIDEKILMPCIDKIYAFGKHTMPHGLAKLVLLEQIYRATTIHANKSYHY